MDRVSTKTDQLNAHFADAKSRFHSGTHEQLASEYLAEVRELAKISKRPDFRNLLQRFEDYPEFLRQQSVSSGDINKILKASGGSGVVDFSRVKGGVFSEAFSTAHLAAICHLLHGSMLTLEQLQSKNILEPAKRFLNSCRGKPENFRVKMLGKLHAMDTIRSIQLVRAMGLLSRPTDEIYQLGLGAGHGTRDVLFLHLAPQIKSIAVNGQVKYRFGAAQFSAAETVIVDLDPHYKEYYEKLNNDSELSVRAYNLNTADALELIEKDVERRSNLVTGMRIDHRMFSDSDEFFSRLLPCLDSEADLLLTMGAGDTVADFKGRVNAFQELFDKLKIAGMQPLLFKLHGPGSISQQQQSLLFGNPRASSYQILYCKLDKAKLATKY